jgi:hypothetical protein
MEIADLMKDRRGDRIEAARRGENPTVLRRLRSGWAVIGDHQRLPGYCLLLHDGEADHLTDLPRPQRTVFLEDLALLGEAVMIACTRLDPELWRVNELGPQHQPLRVAVLDALNKILPST